MHYCQVFLSVEVKLQDASKSIRVQREKVFQDSSSNYLVSIETSFGENKTKPNQKLNLTSLAQMTQLHGGRVTKQTDKRSGQKKIGPEVQINK